MVRVLGKSVPKKPLIACLVPLVPLIPYFVVGVETLMLGWTLKPAIESELHRAGDTDKVRTVRVLWPVWGGAHIYFIQDCGGVGTIKGRTGATIDIVRKDGTWKMAGEPDFVWTDCGNAEGNIFPPYLEGF